MPHRDPVFRVFVSSTFSDLIAGRNVLFREVSPSLRDSCRGHGACCQAVDLRRGAGQEAAIDHRAMNVCRQEPRLNGHPWNDAPHNHLCIITLPGGGEP